MNPIELRAVNRTGVDIEPIPFPQGGPFGKNVLPVNANVELVDAAVLMLISACRPAPAPNPSVLRSQKQAQTMMSGTIMADCSMGSFDALEFLGLVPGTDLHDDIFDIAL